MILYSVNCKAEITNNEWAIITIHKSLEGAKEAMEYYKDRWDLWNEENDRNDYNEFTIVKIDTDVDSDIIYDCDSVNGNS